MGNESEGMPKFVLVYFLAIFLSALLFVGAMAVMVVVLGSRTVTP
jgi:hypothetical protein